ncbi:MAG: NAD(+) diphosphatase [Succinivibrionaceae bacterium]|nr:NAD(+) diphosphatase [Succinivibrionaceae bacterium]
MLQDIAPHRLDLSFAQLQAGAGDRAVAFLGDSLLLREDGALPRVGDLGDCHPAYLGILDGHPHFLCEAQEGLPGFRAVPPRELRQIAQGYLCHLASVAFQLHAWYRDNRFCGRCGALMGRKADERAMLCPRCGNTVYPRIMPAIIVGLYDGERIVVTRYRGRDYKGTALIAGFCEVGETPEMTVARECREEVGLSVAGIRYFASQPWGFDSDLLLGFFARLEGSDAITREEGELSEALWVPRDELAEVGDPRSLTSTMMMHFKHHPEWF